MLYELYFQVYVLLIRNVTLKDAGMYICELNTPNVTQSFHELKVISDRLLAPVVASDHLEDVNEDNDDARRRVGVFFVVDSRRNNDLVGDSSRFHAEKQ